MNPFGYVLGVTIGGLLIAISVWLLFRFLSRKNKSPSMTLRNFSKEEMDREKERAYKQGREDASISTKRKEEEEK